MSMYTIGLLSGLAAVVAGGGLLAVFGAAEDALERMARRRRLAR